MTKVANAITRRRLLKGATAGAALQALGWPRLALANRELVIGHWGGAGPALIRKVILPDLTAKFPDAKVFIREGPDGNHKALLYANPQNPEIDILYVGPGDPSILTSEGFTEAPNAKAVPDYVNLYPEAQKDGYGCYLDVISTLYNPKRVTSPPKSWLDLWKPEFQRRISIPNTKTYVNQLFVVGIIRAMGGDEKRPKDVQEARKKLLELRPNIIVSHTGTAQALTVMQSGDAWLAVGLPGYAFQAKDRGQAVDVSHPREGVVASWGYAVIAKNSRNKELAYAYMQLALGSKAQRAFAEQLYWAPTNKTVDVSKKARSRLFIGEEAVKKLINSDWVYLVKQRAEWDNWWDTNMGQ